MWMGVFAATSADTTIKHLDLLITYITNDKMTSWFMQEIHWANVMAIIKTERGQEHVTDHKPVVILATINTFANKTMMHD